MTPASCRSMGACTCRRIAMVGDSRGHWEGDTLVVDTTGFTNKSPAFQLPLSIETALDGGTVGSGVDLHLVERFTPVGEGRCSTCTRSRPPPR